MAKKNVKYGKHSDVLKSESNDNIKNVSKQQLTNNSKFFIYFGVLVIIAITIVTFLPALKNGLTNWDDKTYLLENEHLYDYS